MKLNRDRKSQAMGMPLARAEYLANKYFDMSFDQLDETCAIFFSEDPIGKKVSYHLYSYIRIYDGDFQKKYEAEIDAWFDIMVIETAKPYKEYIQLLAL